LRAAHKSLNDQLRKAKLTPFLTNYSVQGGTMCFAWPERKVGVAIMARDEIGLTAISNDWKIYQLTANQAKNENTWKLIEELLKNSEVKR